MKTIDFQDVCANNAGEEREAAIGTLISHMSLSEKIKQVNGGATLLDLLIMPFRYNHRAYPSGENRRLKIPALRFTDGPRGVGIGESTCFPAAIGRGASWDVELEERVAQAMGIEASAQGANFFAGICINIPRHPSWGRTQETFGEASHLLAEMAIADINGLQPEVMACVKHFACNSMEDARFKVDVKIDEQVLHETYLPHFKRAVEAGAAAIMSAYNRVNGHYCGHNSELLQGILKDSWGFKGLVMSDFVFGLWSPNAIKYGLDLEMPFPIHYARRLYLRIKLGQIEENHLDEAVRRILRTKAEFIGATPRKSPSASQVASTKHRALAREASQKSIVLLKNANQLLPLNPKAIKRIAVLGPWSDKPNLGDRGSSRVRPSYVATVLDGIRESVDADVEVLPYSGDCIATAEALSDRADVSIVVVGLSWREEGEYLPVMEIGGDRDDLCLPSKQEALITAIARRKSTPTVVVVQAGSAIVMENWRTLPDAILMAWYPGMEGGRALADLLFGHAEAYGRLPMTFPRSMSQLPPFDKNATEAQYEAYHGYRWFQHQGEDPAFHLGFGLSYTDFSYGLLRVHIDDEGQNTTVSCMVSNTGTLEANALLLALRARIDKNKIKEPGQLCSFSRVNLKPQESAELKFSIERPQTYRVEDKTWQTHQGSFEIQVGPNTGELQTIRIPAARAQ